MRHLAEKRSGAPFLHFVVAHLVETLVRYLYRSILGGAVLFKNFSGLGEEQVPSLWQDTRLFSFLREVFDCPIKVRLEA